MEFLDMLVPTSLKKTIKGTNGAKYVTVHETGNKSAGALNHAKLQARGNPDRQASWTWQVDHLIAIRSYLDTDRCMHAGDGAGDGNMQSVAIEICVNGTPDQLRQAYENAAELIRTHYPRTPIVQHHHWSKKDCPEILRSGRVMSWASFLDLCKPRKATPALPVPIPVPVGFQLIGGNMQYIIANEVDGDKAKGSWFFVRPNTSGGMDSAIVLGGATVIGDRRDVVSDIVGLPVWKIRDKMTLDIARTQINFL